jgi:toxin ParE1/3/4
MRLVVAEPAERDLDSIIAYIAIDNPTARREGLSRHRRNRPAADRLPEHGPAGRLPGTVLTTFISSSTRSAPTS